MKATVKSLLIYICHLAAAIVATMILCSIFVVTDFLKAFIELFFFRIVAYSLLAAMVVAFISIAITIKAEGKFRKLKPILNVQGIFSVFMLSCLFAYNFLTLSTFGNERSYTIFSLGELYDHSDTVYSQSDMEQVFISKFVLEGGATKKRIDEQVSTGYFKEVDGGYQISESGKTFVELQRLINRFFPVSTDPSSIYPNGKDYKRDSK